MLLLALLGAGAAVAVTAFQPHGDTEVVAGSGPSTDAGDAGGAVPPVPDAIYVHVVGQVRSPGLYVLGSGDRALDAVAAAGGFTGDADPRGLNLARPLLDGEQLVVPAVGEVPEGQGAGGAVSADGRVNLNTADAAALETLPRIGPALAQRILDWRQRNGRFAAVDDLLAVSGIGAATLEQLRDLVTI